MTPHQSHMISRFEYLRFSVRVRFGFDSGSVRVRFGSTWCFVLYVSLRYLVVSNIRWHLTRNVEDGRFPDSVIREIQSLRNLKQENIINLLGVFPKFPGLTLVLEFMPISLDKIIKKWRKAGQPMPEAHVKSYMKMLLQGVAYCHEHRVMHRVSEVKKDGGLKSNTYGNKAAFYIFLSKKRHV